ncbi:MAG: type II toxin-antitoxin system RelE/ParE family toxin [Brevinematales bacterium]|nr:type II toxin-antitoxin system RelE/ParE family toxin [Brevinematales bacterium]
MDTYRAKIGLEPYRRIAGKISEFVYAQLKANPFFGNYIKKLKGEYKDVYRYRIGDFRLFYIIDEDKKLVIIVDIEQRKDAY